MKFWSSLRESSSRQLRRVGAAFTATVVGLAMAAGCLNRPVVEQTPQTSNVFVDQIRQTAIDKIDLLFVIDNSISMADKQAILAIAVPGLVERLVNPDCVQEDIDGNVTARQPAPASGECPDDWVIEFNPVENIHIGVVTSSLGGHGGDICHPDGPQEWNETKNDKGHLLPTVRPAEMLPSSDPAGFLAWNGGDAGAREQLKQQFTAHVEGAGEVGCGYEATLEAWYRFLIDPTPPAEMVRSADGFFAVPATDPATGLILVDDVVLAQRQAFLRPDSLVAIIMLTDENDCSVVDGGVGFLTALATSGGGGFTMPNATGACAANPNDPCCRSCSLQEAAPPGGCPALTADPGCTGERVSDSLNLRCWDQKRRFGLDLLYPIERYVAALKDPLIYDTQQCANNTCPLVQNPLFDVRDAPNPRDPSLVFLAGIVGVPWQDIATPETRDTADQLEYMTALEMEQNLVWQIILGDPENYVPPNDALMIEQSDPRSGMNPHVGALAGPDSTDPRANPINGHEYNNIDDSDLQYACIFQLDEPRDCTDMANQACDCLETDIPKNRPLCNPPNGGPAGTTQYFAKAYPGTRLLQTLRDFGDNSIVASICPKVTTGDTNNASFGYNPAVAAIIDRLKEVLGGRCLPRELVPNPETGLVPCAVVEATLSDNPCDPARGRGEVNPAIVGAVHKQLEASGSCGGATGTACGSYNLCEIKQLAGDNQSTCLNTRDYPETGLPGYCYVDENNDGAGLLQGCPATEPRKLQFVGADTPKSGSITFIACVGAAFTDEEGNPTGM